MQPHVLMGTQESWQVLESYLPRVDIMRYRKTSGNACEVLHCLISPEEHDVPVAGIVSAPPDMIFTEIFYKHRHESQDLLEALSVNFRENILSFCLKETCMSIGGPLTLFKPYQQYRGLDWEQKTISIHALTDFLQRIRANRFQREKGSGQRIITEKRIIPSIYRISKKQLKPPHSTFHTNYQLLNELSKTGNLKEKAYAFLTHMTFQNYKEHFGEQLVAFRISDLGYRGFYFIYRKDKIKFNQKQDILSFYPQYNILPKTKDFILKNKENFRWILDTFFTLFKQMN